MNDLQENKLNVICIIHVHGNVNFIYLLGDILMTTDWQELK